MPQVQKPLCLIQFCGNPFFPFSHHASFINLFAELLNHSQVATPGTVRNKDQGYRKFDLSYVFILESAWKVCRIIEIHNSIQSNENNDMSAISPSFKKKRFVFQVEIRDHSLKSNFFSLLCRPNDISEVRKSTSI